MKHKIFIAALIVISLASFSVFSAAVAEENTTDFSTLDIKTATFETIMKSFDSSVASYREKYDKILATMSDYYSKGDVENYFDAKGMLNNLQAPVITKEQTKILADRIAEKSSEEATAEFAKWLYSKSRYFRPTLSFTSGDSENSWFRYQISVLPGNTVTLPDFRPSLTGEGLFVGWGTDSDEVLYKAGDEIQMPYTDATFKAVFKEGVLFTDSITGVEVFEEGDEINAPELTAPDESFVFLGWYDSFGEKADGSKTLEEGQSEVFYARWASISISNARVRANEDLKVESGRRTHIYVDITNAGNTSLPVTVKIASESGEALQIPENEVSSVIRAGVTRTAVFSVVATGDPASQVNATVTVTDQSGNEWTMPVTLTIE